ncbi:hypothetical protein D918_08901 [Trichuris suis]|nr:hypothetical protein D918_08901 [Trichuris suis]
MINRRTLLPYQLVTMERNPLSGVVVLSFPGIDGDVFGGHMVVAKEIGHVRRSARIVVRERTCTAIDKQKCCFYGRDGWVARHH